MRHPLFVVWILVSIIGYSLALSFDVHEQHNDQQAHAFVQHDHDMSIDYDHCCHGSVHLLGLNSIDLFDFSIVSACPPCRYSVIAVQPPSFPLFRPPKLI